MKQFGRLSILAAMTTAAALTACASSDKGGAQQVGQPKAQKASGGFLGLGRDEKKEETPQIGVNTFLYHATLETLSFMPLVQSDPFGGVIITDWTSDHSAPNERFKATVYILDTRLRADGLKVNLFKQVNGANGWQDAAVSPDATTQIENAILSKARELRLSTLRK
jgi:hypothetical protein